jgi:enediyne biosynthesis protein E4
MTVQAPRIRRQAARLTALLILLALYGFTRNPSLPADERAALAAQFRFERTVLPAPAGPSRNVRQVHPSFYNHASWVSAIGAAVALADLDGDARPNDLCSVDPRSDQVLAAPVPGTPQRFAPFLLKPAGLPYDPRIMAPMGCMVGDFNEDAAADLLVYYWGRTPVLFLRRAGAGLELGAAAFRGVELVAPYKIWNTAVATQADFDGDGHVDVVFGNYFQDGAAVLDAAGTGLEAMQDSMSRAFNGGVNHLFLWAGGRSSAEPDARFREAEGAFAREVAAGWTLSVGAADLDGDLLPELYFGNDFGPDRLLHNRSRPGKVRFAILAGEKGLTTPSSKVLGRDSFKGMGVDFGDLDGDGLTDIYVSNIANEFALEESHFAFINTGKLKKMKNGTAPFVDRSEDLGLSRSAFSWEARLADFNNDGVDEAMQATGFVRGAVNRWPELQELAMANDRLLHDPRVWPRFRPGDDISGELPNPFFVRSRSGRYFDLAHDLGIDQIQVSRGIATADIDADGDLDFAVANQWEDSYLYVNRSPGASAFLGLRLLLPVGAEPVKTQVAPGLPRYLVGRPAIGARATVQLPDGRRLTSEVDGGTGHSGDCSQDLHFGLGKIGGTPVRVEVAWRDARGVVHRMQLRLAAGWHTVVLGSGEEEV